MSRFRIQLEPSPAARDASRASRIAIAGHVFAQPVVRPLPRPELPAGETGTW